MMDVDELLEMYASGIAVKDIALELGVAPSTVRYHLNKEGVSLRQARKTHPKLPELAEKYLQGQRINQELRRYGISWSSIYTYVTKTHPTSIRKILPNDELDAAIDLYVAGIPIAEIMKKTGVWQARLHQELHKRGVQLRRSEEHRAAELAVRLQERRKRDADRRLKGITRSSRSKRHTVDGGLQDAAEEK